MLRASGETIDGPRPCDSFEVFVDEQGDLVLALMDVPASVDPADGFVASLMSQVHLALLEHQPLHTLVNALEMELAARPFLEAGLIVLRISQRDAKVELLNAGMPAVACAGPGEHVSLHPALSGPIGRRIGEVHPYELLALSWGSTWLAVSDGMMNGSLEPERVAALCTELDLASRGVSLSALAPDQLYDVFRELVPGARFLRDDASFVLASADSATRFQSGIV